MTFNIGDLIQFRNLNLTSYSLFGIVIRIEHSLGEPLREPAIFVRWIHNGSTSQLWPRLHGEMIKIIAKVG